MSRINKRRRRKNSNEQEQNISDLQALRVLVELLVRERVEKQVYESKQELEAEYKHVLKLAMVLKGATETTEADSDLSEINAIIKRVEDKANQIDEAFDKVNASPKALTLDTYRLANGRVGFPKDAEMLIEELELFFAQTTDEILILSRKQILYVLEKNKQTRDTLVQGISKSVTSIKSHKELLPAKELLADLDTREKNILTSQLIIDTEVDALLQRMQEPEADIQLVFSEYEQILHLLSDFHGQMNEMLEQITQILAPLHEKRRLRSQRQRFSAMVKVILVDAMVYLLWTVQQGMFQPQLNAMFAFILTGIILTFLTVMATVKLAAFEDDHPTLFTVTKSAVLNKIIMHGMTVVFLVLLIIFNYIVVLYYLYLLLYHLFNYLDTVSTLLTWIVNISTIVSVAFILARKVKQVGLSRNVKQLFSLLSGR